MEVAAYTDKTTYKTEHIKTVDKLYSVCYNGMPVEIVSGHLVETRTRQQKTIFKTRRQAERVTERLNTRYKTDRFTVECLGVSTAGTDKTTG